MLLALQTLSNRSALGSGGNRPCSLVTVYLSPRSLTISMAVFCFVHLTLISNAHSAFKGGWSNLKREVWPTKMSMQQGNVVRLDVELTCAWCYRKTVSCRKGHLKKKRKSKTWWKLVCKATDFRGWGGSSVTKGKQEDQGSNPQNPHKCWIGVVVHQWNVETGELLGWVG